MVYTSQAIKIISQGNFIFSPHFSQPLRKFQLSVKFRGWGKLNLNIELLQRKWSDFQFNLTKENIHNRFHIIVSPVGVFFSNLFPLNIIRCNKKNLVIFKLLFLSYMPTTLYFSFYHVNSITMLYIVHKYKKKFESTNMNLTHL